MNVNCDRSHCAYRGTESCLSCEFNKAVTDELLADAIRLNGKGGKTDVELPVVSERVASACRQEMALGAKSGWYWRSPSETKTSSKPRVTPPSETVDEERAQ